MQLYYSAWPVTSDQGAEGASLSLSGRTTCPLYTKTVRSIHKAPRYPAPVLYMSLTHQAEASIYRGKISEISRYRDNINCMISR